MFLMVARRISPLILATAVAVAAAGCSSVGPTTVARDRSDYAGAIGASWKQQTLLNIVKLRYGDFPVFLEIAQVIAGYQVQTTAAAGFSAQNYLSTSVGGPAAIGGTAGVGATYIDRPTVIYAPLTGNDFIKTLLRPIPPSAILFLLQSGYPATVVMPLAVDSINGVANESRRAAMSRAGDPEFFRLAELLTELQRANALQIRIERSKDNTEVSVIGFPPIRTSPDIAAKIAEVRRILHLTGAGLSHQVRYGGWSGRGDEIAITTRSMLQVMVELGVLAQVPETDVTGGRATPGPDGFRVSAGERPPLLNILSGPAPPSDSYAAVQYNGRWFWISDTDIRSKSMFSGVMLLFSISDVGVRTAAPVVTVPAQ
ncbi:hypothetical protein [Reyranella sp.]|jgi:hypothetical protein|uniref:hypothetical protein n=1 Tax=Reyranella sp. TaxID=1929291 RepID=UPI003F6F923E